MISLKTHHVLTLSDFTEMLCNSFMQCVQGIRALDTFPTIYRLLLKYIYIMCVYIDQKIFGDNFLEMSREDIGYLFPNSFVLGMKLYKIVQSCRQVNDLSLTESEYENDNMSTMSNSSTSATSTMLGKRSCSSTDKASSSSTSEISTKRSKLA